MRNLKAGLVCAAVVLTGCVVSVGGEEDRDPTQRRAQATGGSAAVAAVRSTGFACIPLTNVAAGPSGYHIGMDIHLSGYLPGFHKEDPYYGANCMATVGPISYYKVFNPGSYPYGLFIDNSNVNHCTKCAASSPCAAWCDRNTARFQHNWANKVTSVALEIYPHDDSHGGVRLTVDSFPQQANGGVYSRSLGTVSLPRHGEAGVNKLNGFVWETSGGKAVATNRFTIDIFHFGPPRRTTTGVATLGFGSTSTNKDGYYRFSALLHGTHKVYLTDNKTGVKKVVWLQFHGPDTRLDFVLDRPCFGFHGGCTNP